MKGTQLLTELRALKDRGVKGRTSGAVHELKQHLHHARRHPAAQQAQVPASPAVGGIGTPSAGAPTPVAPTPGGSSVATPGAGQGQTWESRNRKGKAGDIFILYTGVHAVTKDCLNKLGEVKQEITTAAESSQGGSAPSRLQLLLQPATLLVDTVIDAKETISERELNSSPAINFQTLARVIRARIEGPIHAHALLLPLFAVFDVAVVELDQGQLQRGPLSQQEQEKQTAAAKSEATLDAVQRDIQRRYEQDLAESSQPDSPDSGRRLRSRSKSSSEVSVVSAEDEELKKEVACIEQALRLYLSDWMTSFPRPANRAWTGDFETKEVAAVRAFLRAYVEANVDTTIATTTDVLNSAAKDMLADPDFPVADAKKDDIVKREFKDITGKAYNKYLKKKGQSAETAGDGERQRQSSQRRLKVEAKVEGQGQEGRRRRRGG